MKIRKITLTIQVTDPEALLLAWALERASRNSGDLVTEEEENLLLEACAAMRAAVSSFAGTREYASIAAKALV